MERLYIITGAAGHLAGTIIKYLRNTDCRIRGLVLPDEPGSDEGQITYYRGNIAEIESMDAIFSDTECYEVIVIHTAGIISIESEVTPLLYKVNVEGTKNVIAQCMRHNVKRLVYVSSVHAIPEPDGITTIREVSVFSPDSVIGSYAKTKAEATQLCMEASEKGMDVVVVHPSGILGPYDNGQNHIVQMVKQYINGKLPGGVKGGYDFVDVRDVAKGCIAACDQGKSGECYILSNRYVSIPELFDCIRITLNKKHKKICFPMKLVQALAPIFESVAKHSHTRPLFTRYSLYTLKSSGHFSHDKATRLLGYMPRDIKETVADTVAFLKGQAVPLEAK